MTPMMTPSSPSSFLSFVRRWSSFILTLLVLLTSRPAFLHDRCHGGRVYTSTSVHGYINDGGGGGRHRGDHGQVGPGRSSSSSMSDPKSPQQKFWWETRQQQLHQQYQQQQMFRPSLPTTPSGETEMNYFTLKAFLPPLSIYSDTTDGGLDEDDDGNETRTRMNLQIPSSSMHHRLGIGIIPVTYTNDPKAVEQWICQNLSSNNGDNNGSIIGFDVERIPRFRKLRTSEGRHKIPFAYGATVQLATPTSCLVVHLVSRSDGRHSNSCASVLKSVLEDEKHVKAGCALDDDLVGLYELWDNGVDGSVLDARSRFDLGTVVPPSIVRGKRRGGHNRSGLQSLSRSLLGVNLPKDKRDFLSDWSTVPLSNERIIYAARDAWAGAAIANLLQCYDPACFSRQSLVDLFRRTETPVKNLVERRRRRRRAKADLALLLHPYMKHDDVNNDTFDHHEGHEPQQQHHQQQQQRQPCRLPKQVEEKARKLRQVINTRVIDHHFVFETIHLEE